jgi:hypothetical protein
MVFSHSPESPRQLLQYRFTSSSIRFNHFLIQRHQEHFCGRGSLRYTVFDLCGGSEGGRYYVDLRRVGLKAQQFLQCAGGPALFKI